MNDNGHHYFISSLQDKGVDDWVTLGTKAEAAALFNPMTGECGEARIRQTGDQTQVYLQLKSGESVILQTYQQPLTRRQIMEIHSGTTVQLQPESWLETAFCRKPAGNKRYIQHRPPLFVDGH